jgi:hypothetical protein
MILWRNLKIRVWNRLVKLRKQILFFIFTLLSIELGDFFFLLGLAFITVGYMLRLMIGILNVMLVL